METQQVLISEPQLVCEPTPVQLEAEYQHFRNENYANAVQQYPERLPSLNLEVVLEESILPTGRILEAVFEEESPKEDCKEQDTMLASSSKKQVSLTENADVKQVDQVGSKMKSKKALSFSAPSSPKVFRELGKSSTLPHSSERSVVVEHSSLTDNAVGAVGGPPRKSLSGTISHFFKRLSPKLRRNSSKAKDSKPWIVVEFSQNDLEGKTGHDGLDSTSIASDHSFEKVLQSRTKEQTVKPGNLGESSVSPKKSTKNELSQHPKSLHKKSLSAGLLEWGRDKNQAHSHGSNDTEIHAKQQYFNESMQSAAAPKLCNTGKVLSEEKPFLFKVSPKKVIQDLVGKAQKISKHNHGDSCQSKSSNGKSGIGSNSTIARNSKLVEQRSLETGGGIAHRLSDGLSDQKQYSSEDDLKLKLPIVVLSHPQEQSNSSNNSSPSVSPNLSGDGQLKAQQASVPRIHRTHQPPRSLNILNKIVVRSPQMEKVATKMASVESIGSCSLDVDATASESSGTIDPAECQISCVSQRTLHSSSMEMHVVSDENQTGGSPALQSETKCQRGSEEKQDQHFVSHLYLANGKAGVTNGDEPDNAEGNLGSSKRQLSYVGISCSVSGYSSFSCYNSKAREGLRSRDSSPARAAFGDLLEAGVRGSGHDSRKARAVPDAAQMYYSEHKLDLVNGETRSGTSNQIFSGDDHLRHAVSDNKVWDKTQDLQQLSLPGDSIGLSSSDSKITPKNMQQHSEYSTSSNETEITKSLVQQRIERLYGPGALAQGFLVHRSGATPRKSVNKPSNRESAISATAFSNTNKMNNIELYNPTTSKSDTFKQVRKQLCEDFNNVVTSTAQEENTGDVKDALVSEIDINRLQSEIGFVNGGSQMNGHTTSDLHIERNTPVLENTHLSNYDKSVQVLNIPAGSGEQHGDRGSCVQLETQPMKLLDLDSTLKHGGYFISLMEKERQRIQGLIAAAELRLLQEESQNEETAGRFRATIGKASLLLSQKFQQFRGLCDKNISQLPDEPFPTTISDLEGFWDMVLIQVNHINDMFRDIQVLKESPSTISEISEVDSYNTTAINGVKSKRTIPRKTQVSSVARSAKAEEATRAREEARRRLAEVKRKARSQLSCRQPDIEIFIPESKE